jgi:hypothetical protein
MRLFLLAGVAAALASSPAFAGSDTPVRRAVERYLTDAEPALGTGGFGRLLASAEPGRSAPWTFTAALYGWATGVEGDVAAGGTSVSIDVPFTEIFDDLTGALMGRFGARKGRWGVLLDLFWARVEDGTTGPLGEDISAEVGIFIAELTGSYRVLTAQAADEDASGPFTLDLYSGARINAVDVELDSLLASPEQSETWVDPIVGFDACYRAGRWLFLARADIGGFGISSDLAWSATVGVAYRCTGALSLGAGYRRLDVDFESGSLGFADLQLSGPYVALIFSW